MSEAVAVTPREDRTLFSLHPEDEVTEHAFHDRELHYLKHALGQVLPELFIARNMAVYWVRGPREHPTWDRTSSSRVDILPGRTRRAT